MEHKDIDRLFQEKLKDVEITPNPAVWNAIEKKLQKKKRRIIPIWWFSGVASLFLLGSFLAFNFYKNKQQKNDGIPIITKEDKIDLNIDTKNDIEIVNNTKENDTESKVIIKEDNNALEKSIKKNFSSSEEVVIKKEKESFKDSLILVDSKIAEKEEDNALEEVIKKDFSSSEEIVIKKEKESVILVDSKIAEKEENNALEEVIKKDFSSSEEIVVKKEKDNLILVDSKIAKKEENNTLEEVIKKDFMAEVNEKDENLKTKNDNNQWAVSPVIGVLKSNSFSQASALDSNLNDNNFSGGNTVSYGINVTYNLNKKWAIKSGIQLQESAFTTNDVTLNSSVRSVANSLENVFFEIDNSDTDAFFNVPVQEGVIINSPDFNDDNNKEQGNIQQNYSYIEIPVEIKYTFFSSQKIKTSVISGFSSLILNENSIISESASFNQDIGRANNLNTLNFSGNLGLDVDFSLTNKLNLNINPVFKTQLNTFSKNSNGFKPYLIGVYTGVIYKF